MTPHEVYLKFIRKFKKWHPILHSKSKGGSYYVHFRHSSLGTLRISDHNRPYNYRHRWHIRTDVNENTKGHVIDGSKPHYIYGIGMLGQMKKDLRAYSITHCDIYYKGRLT